VKQVKGYRGNYLVGNVPGNSGNMDITFRTWRGNTFRGEAATFEWTV